MGAPALSEGIPTADANRSHALPEEEWGWRDPRDLPQGWWLHDAGMAVPYDDWSRGCNSPATTEAKKSSRRQKGDLLTPAQVAEVRQAMEAQGITLRTVCHRAHVQRQHLEGYLSRRMRLVHPTIARIRKAVGL